MADDHDRRRRSLGHVWRRGREILREEGWVRLVFMVLADLGYRRFLLYERRLDAPIALIPSRVALVFGELQAAAFEEHLRMRPRVTRRLLDERFARGDRCFVARSGGRIVAVSWFSRDAHFFRSIGCRYAIPPSEVYLYDSFTDASQRGRGVGTALDVWVLERLRQAGVTRAAGAIEPENAASRRSRAKTGFRPFMRIDCVHVGRRRWHWHRAVDARGRARWRAGTGAPTDPVKRR